MAEVVAARLGWDEADIEVLRMGAALHDIGKLAVPERSSPSRAPWTTTSSPRCVAIPRRARGWSRASRRCGLRCRRCSSTTSAGTAAGIRSASRGTRSRWEARVLAVVDAFDAMTSTAPTGGRSRRSWPSSSSSAARARSSIPRSCRRLRSRLARRLAGRRDHRARASRPRRRLERGPDLELPADAADHLVRELARAGVAAEVGGARPLRDGLEARLADRPRRLLSVR